MLTKNQVTTLFEKKARVSALKNQIETLKKSIESFSEISSKDYFNSLSSHHTSNIARIVTRYNNIRAELRDITSDFYGLHLAPSINTFENLEDILSETNYIIHSIENLPQTDYSDEESSKDSPNGVSYGQDSTSNAPFTDDEKFQVVLKLDEIQHILIKEAQEKIEDETAQINQIKLIQEEISELKNLSETTGRKDWRLLAINSFFAIAINYGTSFTYPYLLALLKNLFTYVATVKLLSQ